MNVRAQRESVAIPYRFPISAALAAVLLFLVGCGVTSGNSVSPATAQTFSISGTISGAGGNGATVSLSGPTAATVTADTSGNYTFSGLSDGTYAVTPSHNGFSFSPMSQSVSINSSNATVPAFTATVATPTFSILGTISGAGANGTTLTLTGAAVGTATTVAGSFSFPGLANGTYTVTPSSATATFSPTFQSVTINGANGTVSFLGTASINTNGPAGPWTFTGGDEFNGTSLNAAMWGTQYTWGCTNNDELEGYQAANVSEAGGLLTLTAKSQNVTCSGSTHNYSSGMVESSGKFSQLYGYFEARIQVPAFQGFWPAFWLMPANGAWPPEVDVIELGESGDFNTARMTLHWNSGGGDSYSSSTWSNTGTSFGSAMHTFAVDWEPGVMTWYIDGLERARQTANVPTIPMYVLANLAVGGSFTGGVGGSTPFPSQMTIDYIRVYKKDSSGCYAAIPAPGVTPSSTCQ